METETPFVGVESLPSVLGYFGNMKWGRGVEANGMWLGFGLGLVT